MSQMAATCRGFRVLAGFHRTAMDVDRCAFRMPAVAYLAAEVAARVVEVPVLPGSGAAGRRPVDANGVRRVRSADTDGESLPPRRADRG